MLPLPRGPSEAIPEDITTTSGAWRQSTSPDRWIMLRESQLCSQNGFPGKREQFHPWALREQYWGCSDMEKALRGARKCPAICIDFLLEHELMWWICDLQRKPKLGLPAKAWESGERHSEGTEIWGCKIHEDILLHTPLTDTSQPSMCFPCLAPWRATSSINDPKRLNTCLSPSEWQTKPDDPWMKNKVVTCSEQDCSMIKRCCHGRMDCPTIEKSVPGVMDLACRLSSWATPIQA